MMENNIVSWITGRSDLKQVPIQELRDIVHQYPYFTLAQLLLTVKMKKDNDPEYPRQLQKTALNFQNPQWLHFQLESLELSLQEEPSNEENIAANLQVQREQEEVIQEEASTLSPEIESSHPVEGAAIDENPVESNNEQYIEPSKEENNVDVIPETLSIENVETLPTENSDINAKIEEESPAPSFSDQPIEIVAAAYTSTIVEEEKPLENKSIQDQVDENHIEDTENPTITNPDIETTNQKESQPFDEDKSASRLSSMLEAQVSAFKSSDHTNQELSFEKPALLASKDYFASIGITADHTINTDFGQKVKRFSDWLKQMKRIEASNKEGEVDPKENQIIMQKADDSNKASDVVTETMVDILIQQGKKLEAIQTLEKLSLLKPEKSIYFASLINNLKNNI